jgi:hypothetical protein
MTDHALNHPIRVAIGRALHHKHLTHAGSVDLEHIASELGVSEDQMLEQFAWLREQKLISGPLGTESEQIDHVPTSSFDQHRLTDEGLAWAESGFLFRRTA